MRTSPLWHQGVRYMLGIIAVVGLGLCLAGVGLLAARWWVNSQTRPYLYTVETVPARPVALVLGAGLRRDGSPTAVLRDRVETAATLYMAGKVQVLLLSGDNRFVNYNEPAAMQGYAEALGVPTTALVADYAGRRTYDSCYRARAIFGVERVIVVTQAFHLPRAVYTCRTLGLDAVGVAADRRQYRPLSHLYWSLREMLATARALLDVHWLRPTPVLGRPEPIFPEENHD